MRYFLILATLLMLSVKSFAAEPPKPKEDHLKVRLFSAVTATGDKTTIPVAMEVKIQPKWDTYWRTPGDAGLAPVLDWKGSENFTSADMKYPAPHRQIVADLDNIIYTDAVTFPIDVTVATPGQPLSLKLHVDFLVCNEICVPEKHDLTLEIPAGEAKASDDATNYQAALDSLPRKAEGDFHFDKAWLDYDPANKNYVVIEATSPKAPSKDADVFIENAAGFTYGKPAVSYDAKARKLTLRAEIHSNDPLDKIKESLSKEPFTLTFVDKGGGLEGTLPLGEKPAGAGPLMTPHDAPVVMEKMESISLTVIFFALLGGLILNLMPCVLPVLSIKILSVVSHGGKDNKRTIFRNFMASAAGIIVSFWLLAIALISLKAAGQSIGWGIQFQHTWFVVTLMLITLFFAVNMWGFFEIPLPRFIAKNIPSKHEHEPTLLGHFFTGVFATLLATPCTAPFLGTAVGFALARGAFEIFTIFTFMGIGLALPFIVLAVSPKLFKFMPKPGKWMITFKRILSVALLLTALWLANIIVALHTMPTLDEGWDAFDEAAIPGLVQEGKTVVVDVTATWCGNCHANKIFVLDSDEVKSALEHDNIVKMQADYTQMGDDITAYLAKFGRGGIPFNVVYGPGAPNGIALPEVFSKKDLLNAMDEAAAE